ncbi:MAG: PucR family transcriptional regulator [Clostridia bacterium]|nr:PucR family transcriptional regulator [Clostridia bacterium]
MDYTVSDFYRTYPDKLKLLAGSGGLARPVTAVGLLDYEMLPQLKGKYLHSNFHQDQLVITTLLYAKDNPFLIGDALKHLINKGTAGLVIKNVFRLTIPETVLRFAEARNFPVLVTEAQDLYVENMIHETVSAIERLHSGAAIRERLDRILAPEAAEKEILSLARELDPSFENQLTVYYHPLEDVEIAESATGIQDRYRQSSLNRPENALFFYRNGLLFIHTWEHETEATPSQIAATIVALARGSANGASKEAGSPVGVSSVHYYLGEIAEAIRESVYAALLKETEAPVRHREEPEMASGEKTGFCFYDELGPARILLPYCRSAVMQRFSRGVLEPLREFDAENKGALLMTLEALQTSGFDLASAAARLGQHENTLRYRLERIRALTGLDFKRQPDAEQLDLAIRIDRYSRLLDEYAAAAFGDR